MVEVTTLKVMVATVVAVVVLVELAEDALVELAHKVLTVEALLKAAAITKVAEAVEWAELEVTALEVALVA
jgi:hypothetical protein